MNKLIERIVTDPSICSGKPCIKGTRIPVHIILDLLATGEDFDGIKRAYPNLTDDDIWACLSYASSLAMEQKPHYNELELKKYEELYSLAKAELEKAHSRFIAIEEKATRHFSLLVVLLGIISIGIPEYVSIVKLQMSCLQKVFALLYPFLTINVLISIFFYMQAISFARYNDIVLNKEMFDHFKKHRYIDVIFSLSKRHSENITSLNKVTEKKLKKAQLAFIFTHITLVTIVLTIIIYVIIKLH